MKKILQLGALLGFSLFTINAMAGDMECSVAETAMGVNVGIEFAASDHNFTKHTDLYIINRKYHVSNHSWSLLSEYNDSTDRNHVRTHPMGFNSNNLDASDLPNVSNLTMVRYGGNDVVRIINSDEDSLCITGNGGQQVKWKKNTRDNQCNWKLIIVDNVNSQWSCHPVMIKNWSNNKCLRVMKKHGSNQYVAGVDLKCARRDAKFKWNIGFSDNDDS